MIHDSCEPPITPDFKTFEDIDGYPILLIDVDEGDNKPYILQSNGVAYVRHGSNDFPPSRAELESYIQDNYLPPVSY